MWFVVISTEAEKQAPTRISSRKLKEKWPENN